MLKTKLTFLVCAVLAACGLVALPSSAIGQEQRRPTALNVINYVTGWTHDGAGYHPAVFLLLENGSGRDLSNNSIKFQARFTDLETTEVTVGRKSVRRTIKPSQQFTLTIVGRESSNGLEGFDLPFEVNYWPKLETKIMCRLDDAGEEGTDTLLITRLDAETRSEEEAYNHLNQTASYNKPYHKPVSASTKHPVANPVEKHQKSEKPAIATAEHYSGATKSKPATGSASENLVLGLLNNNNLPGLGDDFFVFEQRYGLPVTIDAKHPDWTFAKYKHAGSGAEVIAGSRERSSKVDLIVIHVPKTGMDQRALLAAYAKQMSGKFRTQTLPAPTRSVRYLPSGRIELATAKTSAYKALCMSAPEGDNSFILVVSRLPQDLEPLLAGLAKKSSLLKQFQFLDN